MSNKTLDILKAIFSDVLLCSPDELKLDKPYVDMGVDSILAIQISKLIQLKLDKEVLSSELFNFMSITELANYIDKDSTSSNNIGKDNNIEIKQDSNNIKDKVAIIGIAGKYPKSKNVKELWNNIINGNNTASKSSQNNRNFEKEYFGSFLDDIKSFDNDFFNISPKEAKLMDPQQRLMMEVAFNAIDDAGIYVKDLYNSNCGVITTSLPGDYKYNFENDKQKYNNFSFLGNAVSVLSGRISHFFNLKGLNLNIDAACSSSLVAIDIATKYLLSGASDTFLVGACSVFSTEELFKLAESAGIMSDSGKCKPFDENTKGFVPAEAVSCIVLKRLSDVDIKYHKIYGIIEGTAVNHDGFTNGIMSPNYQSQKELIESTYKKNDIDVSSIGLVECHGTGTRIGDPIELRALREAYENLGQYSAHINSSKASLGHSLVASGLTSLIKILLCFDKNQIPPQINFNELNKEINLGNFSINNNLIPWPKEKKLAAISAFGFGGTNSHLVIRKPEHINRSNLSAEKPFIFLFSAQNVKLLYKQLKSFVSFLEENGNINLENLSYSQNCKRNHFSCRIVIIAHSAIDLGEKIQLFLDTENIQKYLNSNITLEQAIDYLVQNKECDDYINYSNALEKIAEEVSNGKTFKYDSIYSDEVYKISLPEYQFENKEFWIQNNTNIDVSRVESAITPSDSLGIISKIQSKLKLIIAEKLDYKADEIALDKPLSDFGVDSIIALQILDNFKDDYSINDSNIIFEAENILDLAGKIYGSKSKLPNPQNIENTSSLQYRNFQNIEYKKILDKDIEWFIFGNEENNPILLLPPLNTLFYVWIQQIKFLVKLGYKVYIPHYPGHGNSILSKKILLDALAESLILSFKNISGGLENIDIVGWSLGGCLGILASVQKQIIVEKLVIINCLPKFNQDIFGQSLELRNELLQNKNYLERLYGETKKNIIDFISANCSIDVLQEYYNELQKYDVTGILNQIPSKTQVILGKEDPVIENQEAEKFKQIKVSEHQDIENGGHFIPLTQPFLFNQNLKRFIEG